MDDQVDFPNRKKQKVDDTESKESANKDIINHLPDSLLHHILSFLPTKSAVSTSILSKRWNDLWMSTSNLEFECMDCYYNRYNERETKFTLFVNRVLRYHSSTITTFRLNYNSYVSTSVFESWISAAVKRQVQELHILLSSTILSLPPCLCTLTTLTVLELISLCNLEIPSKVCLSSLKFLHLHGVEFIDEISFDRLFSGLPKIEELQVYCEWKKLKNVVISLPTLSRLNLTTDGYYGRLPQETTVVKVTAKNLVSLRYDSDLSIHLLLDDMPSLEDASIRFNFVCEENARAAQYTLDLFRGLGFARSIKITQVGFGGLPYLENINLFPMFVNLWFLKVDSMGTRSRSLVELLSALFRNAPALNSLVIKNNEWYRDLYPRCTEFISLKDCSIENFKGSQDDMLFVESLLKAAKVLKRLNIHCSRYLCSQPKELKAIINRFEMLSIVSNSCAIEFI